MTIKDSWIHREVVERKWGTQSLGNFSEVEQTMKGEGKDGDYERSGILE